MTIDEIQHKISLYQASADEYDNQIKRLQPVYDELGAIKDDFRRTRKEIEAVFDEKMTWSGDKYMLFRSKGNTLDTACRDYYNTLDIAQDAVNEKIGELKAKKLEMIPIINDLAADYQSLKTEVQNALN